MANRDEGKIENVQVVVRIRPLSKKEINKAQVSTISVFDSNTLAICKNKFENCTNKNENDICPQAKETKNSDEGNIFNNQTRTISCQQARISNYQQERTFNSQEKIFKFDRVFPEESTQIDLYKHIAFPIVEKTLKGYNSTIFAYGQTGTGKTYTMTGSYKKPDQKGIIPNAFDHIFTQISRSSEEKSFVVTVTFLEIYNEDVHDLLSSTPNKNLEIRERIDIGVYVKELSGYTVDSVDSIKELMRRGNRNRITRATLMNDISSRSHAIFTITVEMKNKFDNKTLVGKLNLVDLAGSERLSRTQATGDRLKEASCINQSLSVLGNVISALLDEKATHIPYRNSKLTRLLQDSLGGNCKTVMIASVSPSVVDYEETLCTLRYASRVKFIKNTVCINVAFKKGLIESFEEEIERLQNQIAALDMKNLSCGLNNRRMKKRGSLGKHDCSEGSESEDKRESGKESKIGDESREEYLISEKKSRKKKKSKNYEKNTNEEEEYTKNLKAEKDILQEKIALIQKKILVGGENLLQKVQEQTNLLEESFLELEKLDVSAKQLESDLSEIKIEQFDIEEKFSNLQEEDLVLTQKINELENAIAEAERIRNEEKHEQGQEIETLLINHKSLDNELKLRDFIIESCIPEKNLSKIKEKIVWNEDCGDFHLKGVAFAGNNFYKVEKEILDVKLKTVSPYENYSSKKNRNRILK